LLSALPILCERVDTPVKLTPTDKTPMIFLVGGDPSRMHAYAGTLYPYAKAVVAWGSEGSEMMLDLLEDDKERTENWVILAALILKRHAGVYALNVAASYLNPKGVSDKEFLPFWGALLGVVDFGDKNLKLKEVRLFARWKYKLDVNGVLNEVVDRMAQLNVPEKDRATAAKVLDAIDERASTEKETSEPLRTKLQALRERLLEAEKR